MRPVCLVECGSRFWAAVRPVCEHLILHCTSLPLSENVKLLLLREATVFR